MDNSNYHILLQKLDEFIRKYYKNQLVKGAIYSAAVALAFYLLLAVTEYYAHFDTGVRTFLFYSFVLTNAFILGRFVIIPVLKLNRLGKLISNEQAAEIIGNHFASVQDKLLNILQLHEQTVSLIDSSPSMRSSSQLIEASIIQKITELKPVPFTSAIDISKNKKYVKYALVPFLMMVFILFSAPSIIKDGTKRLVEHRTYFEKEAPFKFVIVNNELKTVQQDDYTLNVKLTGDEVPDNVFIDIEGNEYKLSKENTVNFSHVFKNVQKSIPFRLTADGYKSPEYTLEALPKPVLLNFDIALDYPKYTGKRNEVLKNTGDMVIPAGTKVSWSFNTRNTNALRMSFSDTTLMLNPASENNYSFTTRIMNDKSYAVTTANELLKSKDSVLYAISVIPDVYPAITVEQQRDSVSSKRFYFKGEVKDDYGFTKLTFNYHFLKQNDSTGKPLAEATSPANSFKITNLNINKSLTRDQFYHAWDVAELNVKAGDEIEYYFEVWDNDGVHGAKSTRTQAMIFKAPTLKEISANTEKKNSEIKQDLQQSIKEAKDLQKAMNDMSKKIMEKQTLSWEDKKKMEELLEKQKDLQQKVENIKNENAKSNFEQQEYKQPDEKIVEKQQQLEELFKNVMTDEMKKLFEEMQKMVDKLDKDKMKEALEKMKLTNKDVEKELDRTLEVFKQLEVEQKLKEVTDKLDNLAKQQDKLAEKTEDKKSDNKELQQKQDELNNQFKDAKEDIKSLEKKNQELEHPNDIAKTEQQQEEIQKEQENSSDEMKKGDNKKASKSQKNAAKKMQEMAQKMKDSQQKMEASSNGEDMESLRAILDNLVQLSFAQEALMNDLGKTRTDNPQYVKIAQKQKKLQDDSKMIEDSLQALSKRNPKIKSVVNREINAINMNMGKAIDALAERQTQDAMSRQQFSMTSINNLALLLNESLQQMMDAMKNSKPGQGSCNKPGGKGQKPSEGKANMRKLQEQMNKQMQKMKEAMEKGGKMPNGKDGKSGVGGMGSMSEEFARLAAQQEAIRREYQKAADQMQKDGKKGTGEMGKIAEKMEETETDLVNRMITQETMKRQQEILTRLLESEKADREREMDEKRESNEAKNEEKRNLFLKNEYKGKKDQEIELLKTVPPSLNTYYKNKVTNYFNNFGN